MTRFQVFLSLWSVTSCLCIYKIRKVAKTKVSNLGMGTENRYFFGLVRNWVITRLPLSFRTNDTVIDTWVVLSPYTSMLMTN